MDSARMPEGETGHAPQPVVIWGAGAIGGTIGAYLARAGRDVLLVDTEERHVEAMNRDGLSIEGPLGTFTVPVRAALPSEVSDRYGMILLAVKAHHTEAATRALLPHLAADGAVVSCQNGLNEILIADIVGPERTIGAFVNFLADYLEPGEILYSGRGAVVVGEIDGAPRTRTRELHEILQIFEPDAILTDNIAGYLWGKAAYGTLLKTSAIANASIVDYIRDPSYREVLLRMIREVLVTAKAEGVTPMGFNGFEPAAFLSADPEPMEDSLSKLAAYNAASAKSHSGVWRDLVVRKRQTDVAAQLEPIRQVAQKHGIAVPGVDTLVQIVGEIERGTRQVGWETFNLLAASLEGQA